MTAHELLARAGLTVVGDVRPGSLFPPEAGRRIAWGIAAPDGVVREPLDAAWWRMRRLALDDPGSTHNPRLPARVLAGLLHDRDTACAAVTNPAIPVPVLDRILTAAAAAMPAPS
jgi:hypothetical protein